MSHQAIYRKFRPKIFDDVLGQEHVVKTLKNQILTNNIAHAYLFTGIRGTGKTSTAKILSRAVNCLNNHDGNPCNECEICKSILDETNMDVIEMDAASNNGVEDIRDLKDKVKFLPVKSKYKVYIIDEVHMLSKGAFNALLKTLEEPPEHLVFILATTEVHKIPATILSRCQRFDLHRISTATIVDNMTNICNEMSIDIEEKALNLIAANSEGAMRDALSILDRCVSFSQDKITYETVVNLLGTVNYEVIIEVANFIINKNIEETMAAIDDILNSGKELTFFLDELIIYFRNLLIIKTTNSTDNLIKVSYEALESLIKTGKGLNVDEIVYYIEELSATQVECKRALNPRILLETKLIKLMHNSNIFSINEYISRLEMLEQRVASGITINDTLAIRKSVSKPKINELNNIEASKHEKQDVKENIDNIEDNDSENLTTTNHNNDDESFCKAITNGWQDILKKIRSENAGLQAIIRESKLVSVNNKKVTFEFDPKFTFHINAANQPKNKNKFKEVLSSFLNTDCEVEFIIKGEKKSTEKKQTKSMEDVYEDLVNQFGEDKVEFIDFKED